VLPVGGVQQPHGAAGDGDQPTRRLEPVETPAFGDLLSQVPADVRDVSFATSVRGYDRREVDAYVERVNRVIAELEISRSPQSAIKHALDRVGEQTSGVMQRGREVAEELTATALAEADHATRRAKVEAEEMVESAQMQAHQLRGQAKEEADEIVAGASAKAAERLRRGEEELQRLQTETEGRLRAMRGEIKSAAEARQALLEDLRQTAAQLEEFAQGMIADPGDAEPGAQDSDPPTERMPKPPTERTPKKPARSGRAGSRERIEAGSRQDGAG
jgi:DivIVA domain-containing protein